MGNWPGTRTDSPPASGDWLCIGKARERRRADPKLPKEELEAVPALLEEEIQGAEEKVAEREVWKRHQIVLNCLFHKNKVEFCILENAGILLPVSLLDNM